MQQLVCSCMIRTQSAAVTSEQHGSSTCTSPLKWGSLTIRRALAGLTLMMRLLPRFSTLHPYICTRKPKRRCTPKVLPPDRCHCEQRHHSAWAHQLVGGLDGDDVPALVLQVPAELDPLLVQRVLAARLLLHGMPIVSQVPAVA
jgi:hypothetical protein